MSSEIGSHRRPGAARRDLRGYRTSKDGYRCWLSFEVYPRRKTFDQNRYLPPIWGRGRWDNPGFRRCDRKNIEFTPINDSLLIVGHVALLCQIAFLMPRGFQAADTNPLEEPLSRGCNACLLTGNRFAHLRRSSATAPRLPHDLLAIMRLILECRKTSGNLRLSILRKLIMTSQEKLHHTTEADLQIIRTIILEWDAQGYCTKSFC